MNDAAEILRNVSAAGFVVVALSAIRRWWLERDALRATLAGALVLLAVTAVLGRLGEPTDYRNGILSDIAVVTFMGSGYLMLEFRNRYLPLARLWRIGALLASAGAAAFAIWARIPHESTPRLEGVDAAATLTLIGLWGLMVVEPVVRFWIVSRERPTVQRARLRSLSIGYGLIIALLVVAIAAGSEASSTVTVATQAAAVALIPALQIAIAPPRWLRRIWRAPETQALRASRDLVMFAPDRPTLAARALDWAQRLVGGDAGFIATERLNVLASAGMPHDEACEMAARLRATERAATVKLAGPSGLAIVAPVRTEIGLATLVVLSGPYIQLFGSEEIQLVTEYATEIGLGLDRVRLTEELQRLDVARREFIANAAHELRTPLTAILGFSSMLSGDPSQMPTQQLSIALDTIHRHALRMRLLINNLLDLAQLEQRKLKVFTLPTSLSAAVKQALDGVATSDEHTLTVDVPADTMVIADPLRLEQIVTNLVTNAYKYGGPNVRIDARADDHMAMIVVSDDGPGVPDDVRAHIFEPFVRGSGTAGVQGSGLGLAIVRNLVQAFGGDAWYEEAQPHGARFVLALKTELDADGDAGDAS